MKIHASWVVPYHQLQFASRLLLQIGATSQEEVMVLNQYQPDTKLLQITFVFLINTTDFPPL